MFSWNDSMNFFKKNLGNQTEWWNWFKKTVKLVYEGRKEGRDKPEDLIGSLWWGGGPSSATIFCLFFNEVFECEERKRNDETA
jgi:hypothetical protein